MSTAVELVEAWCIGRLVRRWRRWRYRRWHARAELRDRLMAAGMDPTGRRL